MRIDGNSEPKIVPLVQALRATGKPAGEIETSSLAGSEKLLSALKAVPDVRAEKVAQAKALIQDPSYPSDVALGKVADLLSGALTAGGQSD